MNRFSFLPVCIVLVLLLSGCKVGFNFTGGGAVNPNLKTLFVDNFSNEAGIVVPYLAQEVTQQIQDRFLNQSRLQLTSGDDADLVLSGAIIRYQISPVAISADTRAEQNRMTIDVRVSFVNSLEEADSWESNFSQFVDFDASQDLASSERDLINDILERITQDIFTKSVAKW